MLFSPQSRVLIQGIAEPLGAMYVPLMRTYGTQIVAGVSPGQGKTLVEGIPVFDLVEEAILDQMAKSNAPAGAIDVSVIFVPPYEVLDAALEAIAARIRVLVIITEGVPPLDMVHLLRQAEATETLIVGPSCPGIIIPGSVLLGTHPPEFYLPGSVGIVSRSGSLTHEVALALTEAGIGQSIAVSIGGDRVPGSSFQQWLQILEEDERTEAIVLVGEIGGDSEEIAARYIEEAIDKPVIAYIAGRSVVEGQTIGHAGAIIAARFADLGERIGTAESKLAALKRAKIPVASRPSQIPELVKKVTGKMQNDF